MRDFRERKLGGRVVACAERERAPPDLKRRSRKDLGPVALRVNAMSSEASERRRRVRAERQERGNSRG